MPQQIGLFSPNYSGERLMTSGRNRIVFVGDSITELQLGATPLKLLVKSPWIVVNNGISSHTTTMILARIENSLLQPNVNCIILLVGVVDIINGIGSAAIIANLQAIYTLIKSYNVTLVVETILPWKNSGWWNAARQIITDDVNSWIITQALNCDFKLDMYSVMEDGANPDCLLPAYDSGDGLHPNNVGFAIMQSYLYNNITWRL